MFAHYFAGVVRVLRDFALTPFDTQSFIKKMSLICVIQACFRVVSVPKPRLLCRNSHANAGNLASKENVRLLTQKLSISPENAIDSSPHNGNKRGVL